MNKLKNKIFAIECNFEELNGIDFRKGCFVGQEVTARMKHKATLKNGIIRFANAPNFNQDISSWDVSKVVNMNSMYKNRYWYNNKVCKSTHLIKFISIKSSYNSCGSHENSS